MYRGLLKFVDDKALRSSRCRLHQPQVVGALSALSSLQPYQCMNSGFVSKVGCTILLNAM